MLWYFMSQVKEGLVTVTESLRADGDALFTQHDMASARYLHASFIKLFHFLYFSLYNLLYCWCMMLP